MAEADETKQGQSEQAKADDKAPVQAKPDPPPDSVPLRVFKRSA